MHDPELHHHHTSHTPEETLALLQYMADHTRHHEEELHDLAHSTSPEAEALIHEACDFFSSGIEKLDAALALLKGKGE